MGRVPTPQRPRPKPKIGILALDKPKQQVIEECFGDLIGQEIPLFDAAKQYGIPYKTLRRWMDRGYITLVREDEDKRAKFIVDHATVAYCVMVLNLQKMLNHNVERGARIFDKDGNPYAIKDPQRAKKRRAASSAGSCPPEA